MSEGVELVKRLNNGVNPEVCVQSNAWIPARFVNVNNTKRYPPF